MQRQLIANRRARVDNVVFLEESRKGCWSFIQTELLNSSTHWHWIDTSS